MTVSFNQLPFPIEMPKSARTAFLQGTWEESDKLVEGLKRNMEIVNQFPSVRGY